MLSSQDPSLGQGKGQGQGKGEGEDGTSVLSRLKEDPKISMATALTQRAAKLGLPPPHYGVNSRGLASRGSIRGKRSSSSSGDSSDSSSDGSSSSDGQTTVVSGSSRGGDTAISAMWRYFHYAASDRRGTVYFTKQGAGAKQGAGFEGGQIQKGASEDSEAVPMISVDEFLAEQGITKLDILKIDAEGNDMQVIRGAGNALNTTVGVFTFEGNGVMFDKVSCGTNDARS